MKQNEKEALIFITILFSLFANVMFILGVPEFDPSVEHHYHHKVIEVPVEDKLSEWEVFTLALIKVESEYNNDAVSSTGAMGYFQMTPIYVKEVNRIHKTNYTFEQVLNFDTAYTIFDLMQKAHNPQYDLEKALNLHNGEHTWYHNRVYKEMDRIIKYEKIRNLLKNYENNDIHDSI